MNESFNRALGERLRAARRAKGLSLGAIEESTGGEFKASVVGAYERGERALSVHRLVRLSLLYGVSPALMIPDELTASSITIDLDALEGTGTDKHLLVERYVSAIRMMRRNDRSTNEIRATDQAILASLIDVDSPSQSGRRS